MIYSYFSSSQLRKYVTHQMVWTTSQEAGSWPCKPLATEWLVQYPCMNEWASEGSGFSRKQASLIVLVFSVKLNCLIVYVYGQKW